MGKAPPNLASVVEALAGAAVELAAVELAAVEVVLAEAESEAAKAEADNAARLGLGEITADEYDAAKAKTSPAAAKARYARAKAAVDALSTRAADLAEQEAREDVAERERTLLAVSADAARPRNSPRGSTPLGRRGGRGARRRPPRTKPREGALLDAALADRAKSHARYDSEAARWHAQHNRTHPEKWPRHLRTAIAEEVEKRKRRQAEDRERMLEASRRSLEAAGFQEFLREG